MRPIVLPLVAAALLLPAACQKEKTPKVDAATEQQQAHDRAVQGPYGAQVKAYDKAKGLGAEMNSKAAENLEKADPK